MTILTLTSIPSPDGMVLPESVMKHFELQQGDEVIVTEAPGGFRVTRHTFEIELQIRSAEEIMNADRDILSRLSK